MEYIEQLITSFIASVGFGVIFNVPRNRLIQCGIVGVISWSIYFGLALYGMNIILASGVASFFVAIVSQLFSKYYRTPVIIFSVCGIIPLVPGGMAYNAMRSFVENDYGVAVGLTINTLMISGAIVMGVILSEVVNQWIRSSKLKPTLKN